MTVASSLPAASQNLGSVYTPGALAAWTAGLLAEQLAPYGQQVVLDPACGDGALLAPLLSYSRPGRTIQLVGADIDPRAIDGARRRLQHHADLYVLDALEPNPLLPPTIAWQLVLGEGKIAGLIANPPWGAAIAQSQARLQALGYTTATGQYDSYDLFVELCLSLAPEGCVLAFILPDSLFRPEHTPLRRLMLQSADLKLIARLGEGLFPDVYSGVVVVVLRRCLPAPTNRVECLRLTPEWRRQILAGNATLDQAKASLAHRVAQSRFASHAETRFDIDVRESEEPVLQMIADSASQPWTSWFRSGRGVELSKEGWVVLCPKCETAHPSPTRSKHDCVACGESFSVATGHKERIVRSDRQGTPGWAPLIVGEDVDRYFSQPRRQIRLGVKGINYKQPDAFHHRKLLVRKTGLGLKAAIDDTGAYTNQVVFHYYSDSTDASRAFLLDYVLGVLCSRVLLAVHLKSLGETEWRSHPYITQKTLASLPIPVVREGTWEWRQAHAIAIAAAERALRGNDPQAQLLDLTVESLVLGLFGLEASDVAWMLSVLEAAQQLEPIATLRLGEHVHLSPVRVA